MTELSVPVHFKDVIGLGQPVKTYSHSTLSKVGNVIGCIVCLAIGFYLFLEGFVFYPQENPDVEASAALFTIGFGVVFLLAALFWILRLLKLWNEMLVVYDSGFAYFNGKELDTFKWEEISKITMRVIRHTIYGIIPIGTYRRYWIHKLSGEELKLKGTLSEPDDFINRVRKEANPHIFQRARQQFEADQPIEFGAITISKSKGIIRGRKNYSWNEIGQMGINKGTLWVSPKGKKMFRNFGVSAVGMPNVDILMAISAEMAEKYK